MTGIEWTPIIIALIAGGLLAFIKDALRGLRAWMKERSPEAREAAKHTASITTIDQNLTIVAKARDELEADNALLRAMLAEERAAAASRESDLITRHRTEMSYRDEREAAYRAEIELLEARAREAQETIRTLLADLDGLKRRHTATGDTSPGFPRVRP